MGEVPLYPSGGEGAICDPQKVAGPYVWPEKERMRLQGYLAHKKTYPPLGPYRRPTPRVLGGS